MDLERLLLPLEVAGALTGNGPLWGGHSRTDVGPVGVNVFLDSYMLRLSLQGIRIALYCLPKLELLCQQSVFVAMLFLLTCVAT